MTHYDTLGVEPTATPDEIKAAFRRCASAAHPDKDGGSNEQMAAINRAYEVLGDPERRAKYDASGDDGAPVSDEDEARQMLLTVLQSAVEARQPIQDARTILGKHAYQLRQAKHEAAAQRDRLTATRAKVNVKHGENLVHMLIDNQVKQIEAQLIGMERGLTINKLALGLLDNYQQQEDQPNGPYTTSTGTGGNAGFINSLLGPRRYESKKK